MPTLVVVRHAKADRPAGVADVDRPLLPRGRDDARVAGTWLSQAVEHPGLIVCSPARRAAETAQELVNAYDREPAVVYDESLYEASLGDLLLVVRGLDSDEDTVLLVGHDPSVSALVTDLTATPIRLRTCGVAVVRVPTPWPDTPPAGCALIATQSPRA